MRIINPVESVTKARKQGSDEIIIKNQDPPFISSPSSEHGKFVTEASTVPGLPNYLGRRSVLELCNFVFLMSGLAMGDVNLSRSLERFERYAADGTSRWHPMGDKIPRFSVAHCSTGTVLLMEALLVCRRVRLYGYHACGCRKRCAREEIAGRNHYWDKKTTPKLDQMMNRYERHMLFYQLLERACDLDFRIARKQHCDAPTG